MLEEKKSCVNCGAELKYLPGSESISCEYCGHKEDIQQNQENFEELELKPYLETLGTQTNSQEITTIECGKCGANQHIEENFKSVDCVYCSTPLILKDTKTENWILPGAIIPFEIDKNEARRLFVNWVNRLWFAPDKLKKSILDVESLKGLYLPYWTFDAKLYIEYQGARGSYEYIEREDRLERTTRWISTSGQLNCFIDDTLIKASFQQKNKVPKTVARWNLNKLVPFKNEYLSGFITEKYTIPLKDGHLSSLKEAERMAKTWVRRDIGGDTQRITNMRTQISEETFKHILLPVYVSAYQYKGKTYNFFVNGQTGIISGKRPYDTMKIVLAVIGGLILILILAQFMG